ncbi:MAG: NAD-dependent epimerase/dehydratase family protein [Pseudomonadota bacterium]
MKVLVCGASGCIGGAVARMLRARGHQVVEGGRSMPADASHLPVDYTAGHDAAHWARCLDGKGVDALVNAVGVLLPSGRNTYDAVHARGPSGLFNGAAQAGVRRIVQVSALGVGHGPDALRTRYATSKLEADDALRALGATQGIDWAIVRPSLVYGPRSQSAGLFRLMTRLPLIGLPGGGQQAVQPIHVDDVAEVIVNMLEHARPIGSEVELAGPKPMRYRDMLAAFRRAQGLGQALWLPVPMPAMKLTAWLAQALPQQALSPDTLTMLEHGNTSTRNGAAQWLGRDPLALDEAVGRRPMW